jgi:hypothetical protein
VWSNHKPRRCECAGHVGFSGHLKGKKRQVTRLKLRLDENMNVQIKLIRYDGVRLNWIHLANDTIDTTKVIIHFRFR